jgi:sec-independent protein translocase protein TatA
MNTLSIFLGVVGPWQIGVVVILVLLLFGGKKIPELMKGIGNGIKEFKNSTKEEENKDSKKDDTSTKE